MSQNTHLLRAHPGVYRMKWLGLCLFPQWWDAKLSQRSLQMLSWTTETAPPLPLPFLRYLRKFCGILLKTLVEEDTWGICRQNCFVTFAQRSYCQVEVFIRCWRIFRSTFTSIFIFNSDPFVTFNLEMIYWWLPLW